jgi:hypothetical protein
MRRMTMRASLCLSMMVFLSGCGRPVARESQRDYQPITPKLMPEKQQIDFPSGAPTAVVVIPGNIPAVDFATWQNTGVCLRTGDTLYIRASGQINYVNDLTVGPDGRGDTFPPSLLSRVSFMALIGRTHFALLDDGVDSSGVGLYGPGFVGSEFKAVYAGRGGYGLTGDNVLYLAVNDSMDNDNGLSLTVHIWVVRDGKVLDAKSVRPPETPTSIANRQ